MSDPDQEEKVLWRDLKITDQQIVCKKSASSCKLQIQGLTSPFVQGLVRDWDYLHDYPDSDLPPVKDEAIPYARLEKAIGHTRYNRLHAMTEDKKKQTTAALAAAVEMKEDLFAVSEDGENTDTLLTIADLLAVERLIQKERKSSSNATVKTYSDALDNVEASLKCELGVPVHSQGIQDKLPNCYYHAVLNCMLFTLSKNDRKSILTSDFVDSDKYIIELGSMRVKTRGATCAEMHFLSKGGSVTSKDDIEFKYLWSPILEVAYARHLIETLSKDDRLSSYKPTVNQGQGSTVLQVLRHTPINLGASLSIYALKGSRSTMYLKDMSHPKITNFRRHKRQKPSIPFDMKAEPSAQTLKDAMKTACDKGKVVVLGTDVQTEGLKKKDHAGNHAFAVYDLYRSNNKTYLKVYNPHGYDDSVEFSEAVGNMLSVTIED